MIQHKDTIPLIKTALEDAKGDAPSAKAQVLPNHLFLKNTDLLQKVDNILNDASLPQAIPPSDSLDDYIQDRINFLQPWTDKPLSPIESWSLEDKKVTAFKITVISTLKMQFKGAHTVFSILGADELGISNNIKECINSLSIQNIVWALLRIQFYRTIKLLGAQWKVVLQSKGSNRSIAERIDLLLLGTPAPNIPDRYPTNIPLHNPNHYLINLSKDDEFLNVVENSHLPLSSLVLENCLKRVTVDDYSKFKINLLSALTKAQSENIKVAAKQTADSPTTDNIKRKLLYPQYRAILETQRKYPLGFLYYLYIQENHSSDEFENGGNFIIARIEKYNQFLIDFCTEKHIAPLDIQHYLQYSSTKSFPPPAYSQNHQPPSLFELSRGTAIGFFRNKFESVTEESKQPNPKISKRHLT